MFSGIRRAFGSVAVKQRPREIVIEGIPADVMARDIARVWKTSKIAMHMFNRVSRNSLSFNSFFALDLVYILDTLISNRKSYTAARVLKNIRDELIANTYLKNTLPGPGTEERLDLSRLDNLKYPPLAHQLEYLKHYSQFVERYSLKGYLLNGAAGSGKTLNTLQLAECRGADLVVVVCPKPVVYKVWQDTITNTAFKTPQSLWVYADGKAYAGERFAVVHYEGLANLLELFKSGAMKGERVVVILDESHNLNETSSLRTNTFVEVCQVSGSQDIIWASGTPFKAMGSEAIPLLRCIDPYFDADTEARFRKIFGANATKALDILAHRLGLVSFTVEKKELDLAPPIFRSVGVKVPGGEQFTLPEIRKQMEAFIAERVKYYKDRRKTDEAFWNQCLELHKASLKGRDAVNRFNEYVRALKVVISLGDPRFCGEEIKATNSYEKNYFGPTLPQAMRNQFKDVKSVIKYTYLKIQGECLGRVLGRTRIEAAVAMTRQVDFVEFCESTVKKVLVFTSFVEALREAETTCRNSGLKPIVVYGATNSELTANVTKFGNDASLNPLIATFQSLSTGVPLTMADTMLLLNSPFRDYILTQAVSRIHRLGQDSQTVVNQLYLDTGEVPNISTRSNEILAWSQQQVEAITGIKSPFQVEELPGMEAFTDETEFDESRILHAMLNHGFEAYGITVTLEGYNHRPVHIATKPAYLAW